MVICPLYGKEVVPASKEETPLEGTNPTYWCYTKYSDRRFQPNPNEPCLAGENALEAVGHRGAVGIFGYSVCRRCGIKIDSATSTDQTWNRNICK